MYLKNYQLKVLKNIKNFLSTAKETKLAIEKAKDKLPAEVGKNLNWVQSTFQSLNISYKDQTINGLGENYPRVIMKVPTGGGKTLLAVEAIREYQNLFFQKKTGLVVWIVPSESIYAQTIKKLKDKGHFLRQLIDQCSGGNTLILEKGQKLTTKDIEENLVILFIMIQSISRKNNKEALRVFQDSGGYESFFPSDNRYDLHKKLLEKIPNLDHISYLGTDNPLIKTSLGNAIRASKPFIIIDEIHKVFTPTAKKTIDNLNPEFVLGLTATPKNNMNIISSVTGLELKEEEMVKLDMHILPPSSEAEDDWRAMLNEIKNKRDALEEEAINLKRNKGIYIRPIALIQVEATGKDQRGRGRVHSLDVKEYLSNIGINPDNIAIKTSSQNDIEDVDLFSTECQIRYIITKEALREGWDCSFAYILGIIPNVNSNTGVTQLVGRILRQPFAKKLGVTELDESYVYYSKGNTRKILEKVRSGFKKEGLEDLVGKIQLEKTESVDIKREVKIRKEFFKKYETAFYLPVWLIIDNGNKKRRFSYNIDIKPKLDFDNLSLEDDFIKKIVNSLSEENQERKAFIVSLNKESKAYFSDETNFNNQKEKLSINYITRRFNEYIENPFQARQIAKKWVKTLEKKIGNKKLTSHFSYIVSMLVNYLKIKCELWEEKIFMNYLSEGKLKLAISDKKELGFKIPDKDLITPSRIPSTYDKYLFEDVDVYSLNTLEKRVGDLLDRQGKSLWWFKNKVGKNWYSIQGWKEYKIRPDFIAAKKKDDDAIELLYVIESKGEHLIGNEDTKYKKKVLDLMTEQSKNNNMTKVINKKISFNNINDNIEFYLIEQDKEEEKIRKLFT